MATLPLHLAPEPDLVTDVVELAVADEEGVEVFGALGEASSLVVARNYVVVPDGRDDSVPFVHLPLRC